MSDFTFEQILKKACHQVRLEQGTEIKILTDEEKEINRNTNYHLAINEWRLFTRTVNGDVTLFALLHADGQGDRYSECMEPRPGWETYMESDVEYYKDVFLYWIQRINERVSISESDNAQEQQLKKTKY